jgi:tetratricopeptide (TPR) repeat protein/tRNA A-37 threonylcarbamoyl transferase component Bud32
VRFEVGATEDTTVTLHRDPDAPAAACHPGQLLADRFEILRFIARGGMGEVYEALDRELRERVAVKTVRREIALDPTAMERFRREVHLSRKVTHPNVCRVFDVFRHRGDRDIVFVTMELCPGETLAQRIRRAGRMREEEARPIFEQIAAALDAAHRVGVVHRDFKSGNVLLVESAEGARAVVTDFGIARSLLLTEEEKGGATVTGDVVGTPGYMAPEQVEAGEVTPATDVYALGVVLYEVVTGRWPFIGDTPLQTAAKRLREAPPAPRTLAPELGQALESVILRCLARLPRDRFRTAGEVLRALAGGPAVRRRRAAPLVATLAALAMVAASSYLLLRDRAPPPPSPAASAAVPRARRAIAVLGFQNLTGRTDAAWLSTAFAEMLATELAAGEALRIIPGENVARVRSELSLTGAETLAADTLSRVRARLGSDLVVTGSYIAQKPGGGPIRFDLRLQDTASGELVTAMAETGPEKEIFELVGRAGARIRHKLGLAALTPAETLQVRGALPATPQAARLYAEGIAELRRHDALAARERLTAAIAVDPSFPMAYAALSEAWLALGYDARAREAATRAFERSQTLSREDRLSVEGSYREAVRAWDQAANAYRTLFDFFPDNIEYGLRLAAAQTAGSDGKGAMQTAERLRQLPAPARDDPRVDLAEAEACEMLGDFQRQRAAAQRAVERGLVLGSPLLAARARLSLGGALARLGQSEKSLAAFEEARRSFREARHPWGEATALVAIGNGRGARGDYAGALELYRAAQRIYELTGRDAGVADVLQNIAIVRTNQGDLQKAREMMEQALAIYRKIDWKRSAGMALINLAVVLKEQWELDRAMSMYEEALGLFRTLLDKSAITIALNNIGELLALRGSFAKAKKTYEEALALSRATGNHRQLGYALFLLGDLSFAQGDLPTARQRHEEAISLRKKNAEAPLVGESELALALIAIEEGKLALAESLSRSAAEKFAEEKLPDSEALAAATRARALLRLGNDEAWPVMVRALSLGGKSQYGGIRLSLGISAARIENALGRGAAAVTRLQSLLPDAKRSGFVGLELEARLTLGEALLGVKDRARGRATLQALAKDAARLGFGLIARKASVH